MATGDAASVLIHRLLLAAVGLESRDAELREALVRGVEGAGRTIAGATSVWNCLIASSYAAVGAEAAMASPTQPCPHRLHPPPTMHR